MTLLNGNTSRYAIYFSPKPGVRLHALGSQWLGRDAMTGEGLDPDLPESLTREEWLRATESPRRYGFHATLKPPFRLAEGAALEDLQAALRDFAAGHRRFEIPSLRVAALGRFLALVLTEPSETFSVLAADSVGEFDRFRASGTEQDLSQRLRDSHSPREREHVLRWGYPYVFDTWKFHMSLTGSLPPESLPPLELCLRERFAHACEQPLVVDSVCIFHEPYAGAPFHLVNRADLRSS
jgi:putative phosphonate metabolism protein